MKKTKKALKGKLLLERAQAALQILGYKILIREYECTVGKIDFIAKRDRNLVFISINRTPEEREQAGRAAEYYVKRYGVFPTTVHEFFEVGDPWKM